MLPMAAPDSRSMEALSSTMYQFPRFWLKEVAPSNMSNMSVTDETSQALRGWLKSEAL